MSHVVTADQVQEWIKRFKQGDRRALARLMTVIESGDVPNELKQVLVNGDRPSSTKVGITGAGGMGKSSLIGRLLNHLESEDKRVAVLACDPQSALTGGALLGDRVRMNESKASFIRSLATGDTGGGVPYVIDDAISLVEAFGFDVVITESIGVGQDQIGIAPYVDVVVLVVAPDTGDDIQWQKAGLMETADLIVVNKGDLPNADATVASIRSLGDFIPTAIKVSAQDGTGIEAMWEAIDALVGRSEHRLTGEHRYRMMLHRMLDHQWHQTQGTVDMDACVKAWQSGAEDDDQAFSRFVRLGH